jgi:hypothetical protein
MVSTKPSAFLLAAFIALSSSGLAAAPKSAFGAWLASPSALRPGLGLLYVVNNDPGTDTTNLITNSLVFGLEYPLTEGSPFTFEPKAATYGNYYTWTAANKAAPCGAEYRDVYALGLLLDLPVVFNLDLGKGFWFGAGGGLTLHLRAGIKVASAADADVLAINKYFWAMGRFLLPSTMVRFEYAASDRLRLGVEAKAFWPLFNLFAGEGYGFFDQAILSFALSVRYRLAAPAAAPAAEPAAPAPAPAQP